MASGLEDSETEKCCGVVLLVFVLNMDGADERWDSVKNSFPLENLNRVSGPNGRKWESGNLHSDGRPMFTTDVLNGMTADNKLGKNFCADGYAVFPSELAIAIGHSKIWQKMVDDDIDVACVLEDDVEPSAFLSGKIEDAVTMPEDADVLMLSGADLYFDWGNGVRKPCTSIDRNGRLISAYGAHAYIITKSGAQRALDATFPLHNHFPQQWWIGAFDGFGMMRSGCEKNVDSGYAYGIERGIIKHSINASMSLSTRDGKKDWRLIHPKKHGEQNENILHI